MTGRKWAVAALFAAFFLWFPPTRWLILFILPLGKGVDDFLAMILAFGAVLFFSWERLFKGGTSKQQFAFAFAFTRAIRAALNEQVVQVN